MLIRVLGAVEIVATDGTPVPLPGERQPALLAALAARLGQVVSTDRLVDLLWAEHPPENPEASLHSTVFKLRSRLRAAGHGEVLVTRERGYLLQVPPDELDAQRFTALLDRARDQPPEEAAQTLATALALWRGPAYGPYADTDVAQLAAMTLEEAHRVAVERRATALLADGRPGEAVRLLEPFVAEHPLREAARTTLMRALRAAGRTAEALDQYLRYRRHLADELGLEPSSDVRALHQEMLRPEPPPPADAPRTRAPGRDGLRGLQTQYLRTGAGNVLAYGTAGTGPRVVVLLGWVSSLDVVASGRDPRSSLLERLTKHLSLTLYDRGGTGLSPGPVTDYGLATSVDELIEVIRDLGPPVSLLAMSAAGPIAVAAAAARPEWVSSLVLFGTFANGPGTFPDKALRDMVVEIARNHWGMGSRILADLYRPGVSDDAVAHMARVFRDSAAPEVAAAYLEATYDYDVDHLLPRVEAPALVLHYRGDRLIPFRGAQDLAGGLADATLVPLDGRVHLPDAADLDLIEQRIVEHVRAHS